MRVWPHYEDSWTYTSIWTPKKHDDKLNSRLMISFVTKSCIGLRFDTKQVTCYRDINAALRTFSSIIVKKRACGRQTVDPHAWTGDETKVIRSQVRYMLTITSLQVLHVLDCFSCLFVLFCWGGLFSVIIISDSFRIGADKYSWFDLHYRLHEVNTNTSQLIYKYSRSASCLIMKKLLKKLNAGHMKWRNDAMNQGKYTCSFIPTPILHSRGSRFHFPR